MKKTLLCASFMLCSLASFAYYGDYENESNGFMTFLCVLILVWGFLNIILFFKLWGATNNIDKITRKLTDRLAARTDTVTELKKQLFELHAKGKKDEAIELLNDNLEDAISYYIYRTPDNHYNSEYFDSGIDKVISKYEKYYSVIGAEVPQYFSNLKNSAFQTFIKDIDKFQESKEANK